MTVDELKSEKQILDQEITNYLKAFEIKTGTQIAEFSIERTSYQGYGSTKSKPLFTNVTTKLTFE